MCQTKLIGQLPQAAKGIGTLPEHFAALPAHRVDDEVGVNVLCVQVGGDQHLAVRPGSCRELFRQLVGLFPGDHLVRRKGLDVVVEPDGAVLAAGVPGGLELPVGQLWRAVLPADQLPAIHIPDLLFLGNVSCHAAQRTGGLLFVLDEVDRGHQRCSCSVSSRSWW